MFTRRSHRRLEAQIQALAVAVSGARDELAALKENGAQRTSADPHVAWLSLIGRHVATTVLLGLAIVGGIGALLRVRVIPADLGPLTDPSTFPGHVAVGVTVATAGWFIVGALWRRSSAAVTAQRLMGLKWWRTMVVVTVSLPILVAWPTVITFLDLEASIYWVVWPPVSVVLYVLLTALFWEYGTLWARLDAIDREPPGTILTWTLALVGRLWPFVFSVYATVGVTAAISRTGDVAPQVYLAFVGASGLGLLAALASYIRFRLRGGQEPRGPIATPQRACRHLRAGRQQRPPRSGALR